MCAHLPPWVTHVPLCGLCSWTSVMQSECEELKRQLELMRNDMDKLRAQMQEMQAKLDAANAANANANATAGAQIKALEDELNKLRQELAASKVLGASRGIRVVDAAAEELVSSLPVSVSGLGLVTETPLVECSPGHALKAAHGRRKSRS